VQRRLLAAGERYGVRVEIYARGRCGDVLHAGSPEYPGAGAGSDGLSGGDLVPSCAFLPGVVGIDEDHADGRSPCPSGSPGGSLSREQAGVAATEDSDGAGLGNDRGPFGR
jgi:hypothetical protein